nr:uncharacterized protein LOC128672094 [Plodia interpunctella]
MVRGFPETNAGDNKNDGGDCRMATTPDRFKNVALQNLIQHIDIYGKIKSSYIETFKRDSLSLSMITASGYRKLTREKHPARLLEDNILEDKISKLSVTTKVSSLYPGHDLGTKKKRLKKFQKVCIK